MRIVCMQRKESQALHYQTLHAPRMVSWHRCESFSLVWPVVMLQEKRKKKHHSRVLLSLSPAVATHYPACLTRFPYLAIVPR